MTIYLYFFVFDLFKGLIFAMEFFPSFLAFLVYPFRYFYSMFQVIDNHTYKKHR